MAKAKGAGGRKATPRKTARDAVKNAPVAAEDTGDPAVMTVRRGGPAPETPPREAGNPDAQAGGQPAAPAAEADTGEPVENIQPENAQSPDRAVDVDHALHGLRAGAAGPKVKLARDPAAEAKVRAILMGGASSAAMFALLTTTKTDDRIALFILQAVQDPARWAAIADAIWGPADEG